MRRFLLICCLLFSLPAQAAVILVFGDSLSAAYGIPRQSGWVTLLQQRLERDRPEYRIINASISGETTRGGLYRIDQTLAQNRPAIVIIELGGNDGLRGLPLAATRDNLAGIIRACRRHGAKVLLIGMRLPPNYGRNYVQGFQEVYPQLAKRFRIRLMPFLLDGIADKPELFQADGIHPTATAQPMIMEKVWIYLRPML
jgi:acyl-CoA thioesterase-1